VTATSAAVLAEAAQPRRGRFVLPSALSIQRASGLALLAVVILAIELLGRPAALDPGILLPLVVLAATALGGRISGLLVTAVGGAYLVLYYSQPDNLIPGGIARAGVSIGASVLVVWIATTLIARARSERAAAGAAAQRSETVSAFARRLGNESTLEMPAALVNGTAALLGADMAVLTVLDPVSSRHFVRAAHGGRSSGIGVEVEPGVGSTGQARRDRRWIVAGGHNVSSVPGLSRRLRGKSGAAMVAVPCVQAGRVIASLTVGRADGANFTVNEQQLLDAIGALATLALAGSLVRSEVEQGSSRDQLTGLYNRAFLDATLEQVVAWRRRTPSDKRPPLSMVMFDVDEFALINSRYGHPIGDQVLRAIATLLRQRFRSSDLVARVGGDSFFVLMYSAVPESAVQAAEMIRAQVRDLKVGKSGAEPITIEVTAASIPFQDGETPEQLLRSAEAALESARYAQPRKPART
jgi:diguanylate cyclase (GGDEF)-like protein